MTLFTPRESAVPLSIDALILVLRRYRLPITDEIRCQDRVAEILTRHEVVYAREHDLGAEHGRIDFYLPRQRAGLELKVKGSPIAVTRQLQQYATSPEIDQLLLLTGRVRLASVPRVLNSKPIRVLSLWEGAFC